jgi:hypothetical protein
VCERERESIFLFFSHEKTFARVTGCHTAHFFHLNILICNSACSEKNIYVPSKHKRDLILISGSLKGCKLRVNELAAREKEEKVICFSFRTCMYPQKLFDEILVLYWHTKFNDKLGSILMSLNILISPFAHFL